MRGSAVAACLLALLAAASLASGSGQEDPPRDPERLSIRLSSWEPRQGDPVLAEVVPDLPADAMVLVWQGKETPMGGEPNAEFRALFGVDLLAPAGPAPVSFLVLRGGEIVSRVERKVEIRERSFPVQELTLPGEMTRFDEKTLARIEREASALTERFSRLSTPAMWSIPFLPPVADFRPGPFGSRRIINGEPRSPHAGIDMVLPEGTPVVAIAEGIVAFAGEQFFGGNSVVLDHGGRLFSVYYHLKEYGVSTEEHVARGQRIGSVGSSGRATGPHLHFGVRAAGGRVDPAILLAFPPR
ncbi:MAG TPA: hypothetical protein DD658_02485 [Deltaproteobacteria bacterium]|nr:hypothetical protein [Deltaproteobacteria bacterium]